jgi:YD repeat-containing protein
VTGEDGGLNTATIAFVASNLTKTSTSPMGRVSTTTLDPAERVLRVQLGTGSAQLNPVQYSYLSTHLSSRTEQGAYVLLDGGASTAPRTWGFGYDTNSYLQSITDPVGRVVSFHNDPVGRPTDMYLPEVDGGWSGR